MAGGGRQGMAGGGRQGMAGGGRQGMAGGDLYYCRTYYSFSLFQVVARGWLEVTSRSRIQDVWKIFKGLGDHHIINCLVYLMFLNVILHPLSFFDRHHHHHGGTTTATTTPWSPRRLHGRDTVVSYPPAPVQWCPPPPAPVQWRPLPPAPVRWWSTR